MPLLELLQYCGTPFCQMMAWGVIFLVGWQLWVTLRDGLAIVDRLHQIPCSNCQFFTNDTHLKCTVHPTIALSEGAIGCQDHFPG